jgi:hypothetical protein
MDPNGFFGEAAQKLALLSLLSNQSCRNIRMANLHAGTSL